MNKKEAWEVFDGLMLGDAGLVRCRSGAYFSLSASKLSISIEDHLRYCWWIRDNVFPALGISACTGHPKICIKKYKGEPYPVVVLSTRVCSFLTAAYSEWYSGSTWNKNKLSGVSKVLPERIMLASVFPSLSLAHWFVGDGGGKWSRKDQKLPQLLVDISTEGFSEKEVYHLMSTLNSMGISLTKPSKVKAVKGSGLKIRLSSAGDNTDRFMDLIKPHILDEFGDLSKSLLKYKVKSSYKNKAWNPYGKGASGC